MGSGPSGGSGGSGGLGGSGGFIGFRGIDGSDSGCKDIGIRHLVFVVNMFFKRIEMKLLKLVKLIPIR